MSLRRQRNLGSLDTAHLARSKNIGYQQKPLQAEEPVSAVVDIARRLLQRVQARSVPQQLRDSVLRNLNYAFRSGEYWLEPRLCAAALGLYGWAIRRQVHDDGDDWLAVILRSTGGMLHKLMTSMQPAHSQEMEKRQLAVKVAQSLVRGDAFQVFAQLFARQYEKRINVLDTTLIESIICVKFCAYVLYSPCFNMERTDARGLLSCFYKALSGSQLMEHMARMVVALLPSDSRRAAAGNGVNAVVVASMFMELLSTLSSQQAADWLLEGPRILCVTSQSDPGPFALPATVLLQLRTLLSKPCLQFALGLILTTDRLRLNWGEGPRHGLPPELLPPVLQPTAGPQGDPLAVLMDHLCTAAGIWRMTVSGPLPPRIAQPPGGWLPAAEQLGVGKEAAAAAAAAEEEEEPGHRGPTLDLPYAAVNVYDMVHAALVVVVESVHGSEPSEFLRTVVLAAPLLVRLCLELRPRHAAARLPGLWRTLARVLPLLDLTQMATATEVYCELPQCIGILLRMELAEPAVATPQHAGDAEAAGASADSLGGQAAQGSSGCAYSVRCALDGGLLPALEKMLCRTAAAVAAAVPQQQAGLGGNDQDPPISDGRALIGAGVCLNYINMLLRYSGVWPAMVAHGSVREVASLIVTLRKVAKLVVAFGRHVQVMGAANVHMRSHLSSAYLAHAYLVSLLEQMSAATLPPSYLLQQQWPDAAEEPAASCSDHLGASCPQSSISSAAGGGVADSEAAQQHRRQLAVEHPLFCSNALEEGGAGWEAMAPMQLEWLVRAGGCAPAGSPAAAQQRTLLVFALTQWLPVLLQPVPEAWGSVKVCLGRARALNLTVLQLLPFVLPHDAILPQPGGAVADQEGGGASSQGGSAASSGGVARATGSLGSAPDALSGGGSCSAADEYRQLQKMFSWQQFFLQDLVRDMAGLAWQHVWQWTTWYLEHVDRMRARWNKPTETAVLEATVLDILEVLALLDPDTTGQFTVGSGKLVAEMAMRRSRRNLLAVLLAAWEVDDDEGKPLPDGALGDAVGNLVEELVDWYGMREGSTDGSGTEHHCNMPLNLPSPADVRRAVEAAGVVLCGNPACVSLEAGAAAAGGGGGSRSAKTCRRCQAVRYCCGECQLAHWRAGHGAKCAELAARRAEGM